MSCLKAKHLRMGLWAVCLAALLAASGCKGGEAPAAVDQTEEIQTVDVRIEVLEPAAIRDILSLPGESEPVEDVTVSAEYGGKVEMVGPEEGDHVEAGEEIVMVDTTTLQAQLNQARADYTLASDLAQRRRELRQQNVISQESLDQAERDLSVAASQLEQARIAFDQGRVIAPISGTVNKLYVDEGEFVARGNPVADIVNAERVRIVVNVPEMDVRWLENGQSSLVMVDAYPEDQWVGKIVFVSLQADAATKTFEVWVELDNSDGRIRPGMMTRAYFEQRLIQDAISVPLFSVVDRGGERLVFVEQDGVARAVQPEFGVIEGDRVQILSGLEAGDHLIVSGQTMVEEGVKVTVR